MLVSYRFLFLILLLVPLVRAGAQQSDAYVGLIIPPDLLEDANSVIRYQHLEFEVLSEREGILRLHRVVTILNGDSDANELLVFYSNECKVSALRGTLYDAFGNKVRDAAEEEITDHAAIDNSTLYQDMRYQHISLQHPTYPYTVEFTYELRVSDFAFINFPAWDIQDWGQACQYSRFSVSVPADNELYYRALNFSGEPQLTESASGRGWTWEAKNLPALLDEEYAPLSTAVLPKVFIALDHFQAGDYSGSMRDWPEFGRFFHQLFAGRDALPETILAEVAERVAGATTDREKIDRLYRYLQEKIRYVSVPLGIGGWQPLDAAYVATNQYGDGKALANYMQALLGAAGIESSPVLVRRGDIYYPVEDDFTTFSFNHVVLYIPEEDLWLECTSNLHPAGYLGADNANRRGLLIGPEGGQLIRTPALLPADNAIHRTTRITLAPDGSATMGITATFSGEAQEGLRYLYHNFGPTEQLDYLHRLDYSPGAQLDNFQFNPLPDLPRVELRYDYADRHFARVVGPRIFVPLNKYFAFAEVPDPEEDRRLPIAFEAAASYIDTVRIALPEGYVIESSSADTATLESAVGTYHAQLQQLEGEVVWVRQLELRPVTLPALDFADFLQFFLDVARADRRQFVLKADKVQ